MNHQKTFPHVQVGHITRLIEPININTPVEYLRDIFLGDETIIAQPIEDESGGVIGFVDRNEFLCKHGVINNIIHNNVNHYCKKDVIILNAREDAERALSDVLSSTQGFEENCMVFHYGRYYGIVHTIDLINHIQELKKRALLTAQTIQNFMTGAKELDTEWFTSKVSISMAHELGGDFHYMEKMSDDLYLLGFFDVSGKNVSAALITGLISGYFSTISQNSEYKQDDHNVIIENLHTIITNKTPDGVFIASIFFFCNVAEKQIYIYNHGFSTLYVIKKNGNKRKVQLRDPDFPPIGLPSLNLDPELVYSLPFEKDLVLFGYSDGLPDAHNAYGESFSEERVKKEVSALLTKPQIQLVDEMKKSVEEFISGSPRTDDITLFQIKFK